MAICPGISLAPVRGATSKRDSGWLVLLRVLEGEVETTNVADDKELKLAWWKPLAGLAVKGVLGAVSVYCTWGGCWRRRIPLRPPLMTGRSVSKAENIIL